MERVQRGQDEASLRFVRFPQRGRPSGERLPWRVHDQLRVGQIDQSLAGQLISQHLIIVFMNPAFEASRRGLLSLKCCFCEPFAESGAVCLAKAYTRTHFVSRSALKRLSGSQSAAGLPPPGFSPDGCRRSTQRLRAVRLEFRMARGRSLPLCATCVPDRLGNRNLPCWRFAFERLILTSPSRLERKDGLF